MLNNVSANQKFYFEKNFSYNTVIDNLEISKL